LTKWAHLPTTKRKTSSKHPDLFDVIALDLFERERGPKWKLDLLVLWRSERELNKHPNGRYLRHVRERFGPQWLMYEYQREMRMR
jgi:hypothetical protein